jgi:hypothetical protein
MAHAANRIMGPQALIRRANEHIRELGEASGRRRMLIGLVCECSRQSCLSPITVTLEDYDTFRGDHRHYLVAPGHIWDSSKERVVVRTNSYWIVAALK